MTIVPFTPNRLAPAVHEHFKSAARNNRHASGTLSISGMRIAYGEVSRMRGGDPLPVRQMQDLQMVAPRCPALIDAGGCDVLRDDARLYDATLKALSVEVEYGEVPGMVRGFIEVAGVLPEMIVADQRAEPFFVNILLNRRRPVSVIGGYELASCPREYGEVNSAH